MRTKQARFRSRIDSWILILLIIAIGGMMLALVAALMNGVRRTEALILMAIIVPGTLLIVSTLLRTHYTVADGKIRVVSGPFAWNVPIAEITDISETHSPLSSPALSLDRLRISYGRNKCIMVSPEDKKGFLRAIEEHGSH
jgi:hypothetical protein